MPAPVLTTFRDAVEHLVRYSEGIGEEAEQDRARSAVLAAYRNLGLAHPWKYLTKHDRLNVSAKYTTGTVSCDASTRIVTGSDTVFPSWARYGRLLFDGDSILYRVASLDSDTQLTLETNFSPASDVAAETDYTLYRTIYPLPGDFHRLIEVADEPVWKTTYLEPNEWMQLERHVPRVGRPFKWTLMGGQDLFGSMSIGFYGRIETAQTFDFIYQAQPRRLKYDGYNFYSSQGTDTISSYSEGGTDITFSGTSLQEDVVNCVVRTAMSGATKPPGGIGAAERYAEQKMIVTRTDATTLVVDSAFEFAKGSDHFTISDPIDLPEYLLELFDRGCELEMAIRRDPKKTATARSLYYEALRKARGNNAMMPPPVSPLASGWQDPSWTFLTGTITQN